MIPSRKGQGVITVGGKNVCGDVPEGPGGAGVHQPEKCGNEKSLVRGRRGHDR